MFSIGVKVRRSLVASAVKLADTLGRGRSWQASVCGPLSLARAVGLASFACHRRRATTRRHRRTNTSARWGGGLRYDDGRPNGQTAKLRGQGPRAEAAAARRLPACEARDAGGVTPSRLRSTRQLGCRTEGGPRQLLR